eukprot:610980-Pleurochrysis_carterae.AAC.1
MPNCLQLTRARTLRSTLRGLTPPPPQPQPFPLLLPLPPTSCHPSRLPSDSKAQLPLHTSRAKCTLRHSPPSLEAGTATAMQCQA